MLYLNYRCYILCTHNCSYIVRILFGYYEINRHQYLLTITQALAYTIAFGAFYLFHLKVMPSRLRAGFAISKNIGLSSITYIIALILIYTYEYMTKFLPKHLQYSETANQLERQCLSACTLL